jgi:hypothetical protein
MRARFARTESITSSLYVESSPHFLSCQYLSHICHLCMWKYVLYIVRFNYASAQTQVCTPKTSIASSVEHRFALYLVKAPQPRLVFWGSLTHLTSIAFTVTTVYALYLVKLAQSNLLRFTHLTSIASGRIFRDHCFVFS